MYYLVYTSHASHSLSSKELLQLLAQSKDVNEKEGITGRLLYVGNKFIQVLEGNRRKVKDLYQKIKQDPRHHRVKTVIEGYVPQQVFGNWAMSYSHSDLKAGQIPGFENLNDFLSAKIPHEEGALLQEFLKLFYKQNVHSNQLQTAQ